MFASVAASLNYHEDHNVVEHLGDYKYVMDPELLCSMVDI